MEKNDALLAFSALGQATRMDVFRLLLNADPDGMAAGGIAEALNVRANTLSANLATLSRAGLIRQQREGRSIRYFADLNGLKGILGYLTEDCCHGRPELCGNFTAGIGSTPGDQQQ